MISDQLRERKADIARVAIFEVLLKHLEAGDADDIAIEDLAREAGVSRRTLYRYFPNRSELLEAAGEWIRSTVLTLPIEIGAEGITGSFLSAATKLAERPALARALLRTETGRAVRGTYRDSRIRAVRKAVRAEAPRAADEDIKRAAAVISYLCSSTAWTTIQDESALEADEAQAAVAWAIETLLGSLS